jgi:ribonuclease J
VDGSGAASEVSLVTRGVVDEALHADEMETARAAVRLAIAELARQDPHADDAKMAEQTRLAVRRSFWKTRGKKPMTVVHVRRSEGDA